MAVTSTGTGPRVTARRAVGVVVALMAAAAGVALFIGEGGGASPGAAGAGAPPFVLPDLREGRPPVELARVPGIPTVVNFFAAWCEPCKRELPVLREAARAHAGEVRFVGVDHQDSRADALEQLAEFDVPYPAGYDPSGEVAARFGVRGMPTTVFVAPDGRIVDVHQGELSAGSLEAKIELIRMEVG